MASKHLQQVKVRIDQYQQIIGIGIGIGVGLGLDEFATIPICEIRRAAQVQMRKQSTPLLRESNKWSLIQTSSTSQREST
jgi:hypothetical protein